MKATYVAPVRYEYSREQACAGYWRACEKLGLAPTVDLVSVLVGHGALECGNFKGGLWCNNPGNIKASSAWAGLFTCITLNEIIPHGDRYIEVWFSPQGELVGGRNSALRGEPLTVPPGHPQTRMRAFDTLSDGIVDKLRFLTQPSWAPVIDIARKGDASGYVRGIRARGYFTAYKGQPDPTPYETSVIALAHSYRSIVEATAGAAFDDVPSCREECGELGAVKFDQDLLGAELRARVQTANEPILDSILAEGRKRT